MENILSQKIQRTTGKDVWRENLRLASTYCGGNPNFDELSPIHWQNKTSKLRCRDSAFKSTL